MTKDELEKTGYAASQRAADLFSEAYCNGGFTCHSVIAVRDQLRAALCATEQLVELKFGQQPPKSGN